MFRIRQRDVLFLSGGFVILLGLNLVFIFNFHSYFHTSFNVSDSSNTASISLTSASTTSTQSFMAIDSNNLQSNTNTIISPSYKPASVEQSIMDHLVEWGWDKAARVPGCNIWTKENNEDGQKNKLYEPLRNFRRELREYYKIIGEFKPIVGNLKEEIIKTSHSSLSSPGDANIGDANSNASNMSLSTKEDICKTLRLHPEGLPGIFSGSVQLSHTSTSGYIEPLTTPMRHPDFCFDTSDKEALMDMTYLIHDFEAMCLTIQPTSRMILIDMGASLSYHDEKEVKAEVPPIVHLLNLYEKFGFQFDHIYGFEVSFTEPNRVFNELLPKKYMPSYHWINAGVSSEIGHVLNPLDSILRQYNKDDFIIVKVDIDTADIEMPLVHQLLEDASFHGGVVNQLYFEHHVKMKEMAPIWRSAMKGSLKETFDLFFGLRERGIPAHFWP
mmetsp:Transcript_16627/g.20317  ORF Transcript_16627/g.20317 Transcript_16627/m.20317 type:complete len:442 (+) Transcript_16627:173-1498(+)